MVLIQNVILIENDTYEDNTKKNLGISLILIQPSSVQNFPPIIPSYKMDSDGVTWIMSIVYP